jgi:hypothetical protein
MPPAQDLGLDKFITGAEKKLNSLLSELKWTHEDFKDVYLALMRPYIINIKFIFAAYD